MVSIAEQPFNMLPRHDNDDMSLYPDPPNTFTSGPLEMGMTVDAYTFPVSMISYEGLYAEAPNYMLNGRSSPYVEDGDARAPPSNLSTASAPSATSSAVGSPQSHHGQMAAMPEWAAHGLGVSPGIVGQTDYFHMGTEYSFSGPGMEEFAAFDITSKPPGFVDPSLIHPDMNRPLAMPGYDNAFQPPNPAFPNSPALSNSPQPVIRNGSQSPYLRTDSYASHYSPYQAPAETQRRPSIVSFPSFQGESQYSGDEGKEKQRCPHPDCGKTFKDLKAHMLTHQNERPEKCPIQTCDYHVKGFARKYDKNRHTLTHYKGTMICGFCPGSGSAAEKSFNRADVFKRHLTAVHGVEQTPPNSRKKAGPGLSSGKKLAGYPPDATGKCSTCSQTFSNAQDFYEHLDDCVLRIVQQEDPAEAINAQRLAEVENDRDVHQTLEKNNLPLSTEMATGDDGADDDADMADDDSGDEDERASRSETSGSAGKKKGNPANGVQKSRGMTHSRGGVPLPQKSRGRKNRKDYPSSWGFDKGQMTMKKRVMAVFDGPRRLAKDDMMLSTDHEVRIKLSDGKSYVTDLDVQTLKRAEGFLNATDDEKGPWLSDDLTEEQMKQLQEMADCKAAMS